MHVEQGTLIPATLSPVGQGLTGAHFSIVSVGGVSQRCVVKRVGLREIAAEIFCALLGFRLSLPVLIPVVVTDPRDQSLWFGARDVGYPSLSSRLGITTSPTAMQLAVLASILSTWAQAPYVISFDELIANGDRNPGNVLWNGTVFTIIDHERALGIDLMQMNKLALFAIQYMSPQQLSAIRGSITGSAMAQQAVLSTGSAVWGYIDTEFTSLPVQVAGHLPAMRQFAQARAGSLVGASANAVSPLLNQLKP